MSKTNPLANCGHLHGMATEKPKRKKRKKLDRLTRDAIAAQEAGMSYGNWKAQHPHTPDEDDEQEGLEIDPDSEVAICERCGERFVKLKWQKTKRFCSYRCQDRQYHEKKQQEKKRTKPGKSAVCPICGADFVADYQHRIYCSSECYAESQRQKRKGWNASRGEKRNTPDEELEIDPDMVAATCEQCGRQFMKPEHQTRKRFCSTACQTRNRSIRMAEKRSQEAVTRTATCDHCGATFTPANGNSKYCSSKCQTESHRQKNRAWYARNKEKQEKEGAKDGSN